MATWFRKNKQLVSALKLWDNIYREALLLWNNIYGGSLVGYFFRQVGLIINRYGNLVKKKKMVSSLILWDNIYWGVVL